MRVCEVTGRNAAALRAAVAACSAIPDELDSNIDRLPKNLARAILAIYMLGNVEQASRRVFRLPALAIALHSHALRESL
jgi:hypothetical protein